MKPNIFLVFYLFHRMCIKIPMIFESVHNLICKIKYKAKIAQKEKGKATAQRAVWNSARRPARSRSAHAGTARAFSLLRRSLTGRSRSSDPPSPSLCGTLTGRSHPSVPSSSRAAALPLLRPPLARFLAHARARTSLASPLRTDCRHSIALYSPPSTSATRKTGGRHDRPRSGH